MQPPDTDRRELLHDSARSFLWSKSLHETRSKRHDTRNSTDIDPWLFPDRRIQLFYYHFHASHPFALPQAALKPFVKDDAVQPLLAAMRWMGSLHSTSESFKSDLYEEALAAVRDYQGCKNGFLVQATLLLDAVSLFI